MSTQFHPPNRGPGPPDIDEHSPDAPGRWAARLQELASAQAAQAPEAIQWRETPPLWQRLKRAISVPIAAAAVVFLAILLFSIGSVWLQPHGAEVSSSDSQVSSEKSDGAFDRLTGVGSASERAAQDKDQTLPAESIVIHVIGEVAKPGVYKLPAGSRALAAIEAAGGANETAVLSGLNLARELSDGEQLLVPNSEQAALAMSNAASGASGLTGSTPSDSSGPSKLVNLNSADASALQTLPHIGPALAHRIVDWRASNGAFRSVDQLLEVSGIGEKTFQDLRSLVTV